MPVYNGAKYLNEAIESILNQTFENFEFLIIDDKSTDNSLEIIKSYDDPCIRLVENAENIGQSATLNKGIDLALGEYIARMDQDDVSLPERLEEQVNYFKQHTDICILGTWWKAILDDEGHKVYREVRLPEDPDTCAFWMYFYGNQPIAHPCVMFIKNKIKELGGYNEYYRVAQDVELWLRAFSNKLKFANVPKFLFYYRLHQNQGSIGVLAEMEHNCALSKFLSSVINRSVNIDESARFRPNNMNDEYFVYEEDIREMMQLKKDAINKYYETYTISANQILKYSMMIWDSLQKLGKLKIVVWHQMIFQNTIFCLHFIKSVLKHLNLPYLPTAIEFIFMVYPPLVKRLATNIINS
jgi:glycosyltransferase involved in cell wall biosynthesis|tara:strand:+ start:813 stop:1877 length:1065 start_codon:yes stop_codon:yes gene_type:complete